MEFTPCYLWRFELEHDEAAEPIGVIFQRFPNGPMRNACFVKGDAAIDWGNMPRAAFFRKYEQATSARMLLCV